MERLGWRLECKVEDRAKNRQCVCGEGGGVTTLRKRAA